MPAYLDASSLCAETPRDRIGLLSAGRVRGRRLRVCRPGIDRRTGRVPRAVRYQTRATARTRPPVRRTRHGVARVVWQPSRRAPCQYPGRGVAAGPRSRLSPRRRAPAHPARSRLSRLQPTRPPPRPHGVGSRTPPRAAHHRAQSALPSGPRSLRSVPAQFSPLCRDTVCGPDARQAVCGGHWHHSPSVDRTRTPETAGPALDRFDLHTHIRVWWSPGFSVSLRSGQPTSVDRHRDRRRW